MLIYSMSVSVDGSIADREGGFGWTVPDEEQFRFHIAQVGELGGYLCGRGLYETIFSRKVVAHRSCRRSPKASRWTCRAPARRVALSPPRRGRARQPAAHRLLHPRPPNI